MCQNTDVNFTYRHYYLFPFYLPSFDSKSTFSKLGIININILYMHTYIRRKLCMNLPPIEIIYCDSIIRLFSTSPISPTPENHRRRSDSLHCWKGWVGFRLIQVWTNSIVYVQNGTFKWSILINFQWLPWAKLWIYELKYFFR